MSAIQKFDKVVWSTCNVNCGSRCPVRLFVRNGEVVRIEPDNTGEVPDGPHEIRAWLRGRGLRRWVYAKERLLHPLKRVGRRGEGRFKRISWDEALDTISSELGRIIAQYGNEAVFRIYGTGNLGGVVSSRDQIDRLMHFLGGRLDLHNSYSAAQIEHAMRYTYGAKLTGNYISDLVNSKLAVFFGNNPAETRMSGGGTVRDLAVARQKSGVRIIVIGSWFDTGARAAFSIRFLLSALILTGVGLCAALAHLTRPRLAPHALRNLAISWLSREVLLVQAFAGAVLLSILLALLDALLWVALLETAASLLVWNLLPVLFLLNH